MALHNERKLQTRERRQIASVFKYVKFLAGPTTFLSPRNRFPARHARGTPRFNAICTWIADFKYC